MAARKKRSPSDRTPILDFFVLLGLLPFVCSYTLFAIDGKYEVGAEAALPFVVNIVAHPLAVIGAIVRRRWSLLLFGLLAGHVSNGLILANAFDLVRAEDWLGAMVFAARVSLLYFAWRGRMGSLGFALYAAAIWWSAGGATLAMFAAVTLGLKALLMAALQNVRVVRQLGPFQTLWVSARALLMWLPILLFAVPATVGSHVAHQRAIDAVYDYTSVDRGPSRDSDFEADLVAAVRREHVRAEGVLGRRIAHMRTAVTQGAQELPQAATAAFDATIPVGHQIPPLAPDDCSWYDLPCHIKEGVKSAVRASYDRARWRQRVKLELEVRRRANEGSASVTQQIDAIDRRLGEMMDASEENTVRSVESAFLALNASKIVTNVLFGLLCLKSFLYVFARVAFSRNTEANVSLSTSDRRMPAGSIRKCGTKYTARGGTSQTMYVSRKFEPTGRAPRFWIPQPASALLARLRHGLFVMNRVDFEKGAGSVQFTAVRGAEFIEWTLKENEVVTFDFRNFVGFTKGVRISSIVSFRISSLLFGRLIFPAATGPGKLILMSQGTPTLPEQRVASSSVPPNRVIAFQQNARFHVDSQLNLIDLYFSAAYLKRVGSDPVVIDADVVGKAQIGLGRFIKYFVLPF